MILHAVPTSSFNWKITTRMQFPDAEIMPPSQMNNISKVL